MRKSAISGDDENQNDNVSTRTRRAIDRYFMTPQCGCIESNGVQFRNEHLPMYKASKQVHLFTVIICTGAILSHAAVRLTP